MKPQEFLSQLDDARVVAAIEAAERLTSGEICVFVSSRNLGHDDVVTRAVARFRKLGMEVTRERNGVLLYFVPRDRKYAVVGDRGIHEKCGAEFWREIADSLHEKFTRGDFTAAVIDAVNRVGRELALHFPPHGDDRNELTNEISRD